MRRTYASLKDQADDEDENFGWDTRYGELVSTMVECRALYLA